MITGFVSDIHEDLKNLEKAFRFLDKSGCEEIICMGDISGYSSPFLRYEKERDASACLKLVREYCSTIIPGNHDLFAARKIPGFNPGFSYPDNWFELDLSTREALSQDRIWLYEPHEPETNYTDQDREYIAGLPEIIIKEMNGKRVLLSHHLYPDITGSSTRLMPDRELELSHLGFMNDNNCRLSFFGHNHVEGIWVVGNKRSTIEKEYKAGGELLAIGLPCIARGRNMPGIAWYDSESETVYTHMLEPALKRLKRI